MKKIKLTKGKFALVDDEDFEWLNQWKWFAQKHRKTFYARRGIWMGYENGMKIISMHRIILDISDPKIFGDHKDRDGLNNQRSNLRIATQSQNASNTTSKINSTSNYLGVSWCKRHKKWKAQIFKTPLKKNLGAFSNEIDAAIAYNKAAFKYHGEFANLNVITVRASK